ncbi:hypothetical protein [Acidaminococcus timonensis]|uniref:hypothetical protein n=1 Tax=Acidaminococcus timonensis TaxID=1871002 RepID=UPI00248B853F|nr:hypothetical protein [Acidaminococcus timonensis]
MDSLIAAGFIITFIIIKDVVKSIIKRMKERNKLDIKKPFSPSGFKLVRMARSGVTVTLGDVGEHLIELGTAAKLNCSEHELIAAAQATLGFVIKDRDTPETFWSNATIYGDFKNNVNLTSAPLTSKNIEVFKSISRYVIYLMACIEQNPKPSKNMEMICNNLIHDMRNSNTLQEPERKAFIEQFVNSTIGEVVFVITKMVHERDYLKEWGVE